MPWISIIPPDEATGLLAQLYRAARERAGKVFGVISLQSLQPKVLRCSTDLYLEVMHAADSSLTRAQREMIAVVVSRENACIY